MALNYNNPINILDSTNAVGVGSGGSLNVDGGISVKKDTFIGGSLSVSGTSTAFSDNIMIMNQSPMFSKDTGILFERYSADYTNGKKYSGLIYSETSDEFIFGYANADSSSTGITFGNYIPVKANQLLLMSTEDSVGSGSGGSLTVLGGVSIDKSLNVVGNSNTIGSIITTGGNVGIGKIPTKTLDIVGDISLSGDFYKDGNLYNPGSQWSTFSNNVVYTKGNVGIGTTSPNFNLDVNGTLNAGTSITTSNVLSTNVVSTNQTVGTINVTSLVTSPSYTGGSMSLSGDLVVSGSVVTVNVTTTNVKDINISTGTINVSSTAYLTNATIPSLISTTSTISTLLNTNLVSTNISSGTLNLSTGLTSASGQMTNLNVTTGTVGTLLNTNLVSTNVSGGTLNLSTGLTSGSAQIINANVTTQTVGTLRVTGDTFLGVSTTLGNAIISNLNVSTVKVPWFGYVETPTLYGVNGLTAATAMLVTGAFAASSSSNTIGSIFTNSGNVGIGTTSPNSKLDVSGGIQSSSITTSSLIATSQISTGTLSSTTISSGNISLSGNLNVAGTLTVVNITATNLLDTNISAGTAQITNSNVTTETVGTLLNTNLVSTNMSSGTLILSTGLTSASAKVTNVNATNMTTSSLNVGNMFTSSIYPSTNTSASANFSLNVAGGTFTVNGPLEMSGYNINNPARINLSTTGAETVVQLTNNATGGRTYQIVSAGQGSSGPIGSLFIYEAGSGEIRLCLNSAGNIGIGTTVNSYKLDIGGSLRATSGDVTLGSILVTSLISTNISSGTLNLSSGLTSASAQITNSNVTIETVGTSRITTSLLAIGNSNTVGGIITTGGNVGIGTVSPTTKLDINGGGATSPSIIITSSGGDSTLSLKNTGTGGREYWIGSASSGAGAGSGNLYFYDNSSGATRMVIGSSGNIGIGNSAPAYKLDVTGDGRVFTNATSSNFYIGNGSYNARLNLWDIAGSGWRMETDSSNFVVSNGTIGSTSAVTPRLLIGSTGNIGIGSTSPISTLDVISSLTSQYPTISRFLAPNTTGGTVQGPRIVFGVDVVDGISMTYYKVGTTSANNILGWGHQNVADNQMVLTRSGKVGIGMTSPSYALHVNGQIYATDDITAMSDVRIKTDIIPLSNVLDKIQNISGVTFKRKDKNDDKKYIGLIAQEVEKEYPELIYTDNNSYKSVAYSNMVAVLLEAVKELTQRVSELEKL